MLKYLENRLHNTENIAIFSAPQTKSDTLANSVVPV